MRSIGLIEKVTWLIFLAISFALETKYSLFTLVLFVLRFKLTHRDISLVKERLSSFIYSPTSGVVRSIKSDEDFFYLEVVLFPVLGDLVLSPGKFKVKKSNALSSGDKDIRMTLYKEEVPENFDLVVTPFLKSRELKTNLIENDIIDENSIITQSFFGGVLSLKFSKKYDLKIKRGDFIWSSRTTIAVR